MNIQNKAKVVVIPVQAMLSEDFPFLSDKYMFLFFPAILSIYCEDTFSGINDIVLLVILYFVKVVMVFVVCLFINRV